MAPSMNRPVCASLWLGLTLLACSTPTGSAAGIADVWSVADIHFSIDTSIPAQDVEANTAQDAATAGALDQAAPDDAALTPAADVDAALCTPGSVIGVVCAPKAGMNVGLASVSLDVSPDCGGAPWHAETTADAKGLYAFQKVPPGSAQLSFAKGSFKGTTTVTVKAGAQLDLTTQDAKRCLKSGAVKIAVVLGDADHIEKILDDLGFAYETFDSGTSATVDTSAAQKLLMDPAKLGTYDVLFVNCSTVLEKLLTDNPGVLDSLQAFVGAGHSLYASDWAWNLVEGAFPDAIQFWGVEKGYGKSTKGPSATAGPRQGPGPTMAQKKAGTPALQLDAKLVDPGLAAVLAKPSTTVYQDLGTWVVMKSAGSGSSVAMQAAVSTPQGDWGTVPLVVSFPVGQGHVVYTSFHNIAQADAGGSVADIKAILSYLVFSL